ncbi:MAG TPA: prolipoprotein diacylglyceryl transferase family protein [Bacteroidia bacterium]|nr:prolipoprotein diacylglyceryl transferase family protein [Bacteroidia bacterium]
MDMLPDFEWFRLFYLLAMGLGAVLVIRAARRDGLSLASALVLFLWAAVFGVLGSRLAELSAQGWLDFLQTGRAADVGKTALGGIVGAILGLTLGRRLMGLQAPVWGWFLAWPAALIVFRLGCLLAGCCAGTPTGLPWALTYPVGMPACDLQHAHGLLAADAAWSLPVHPVPIYEMLLGALLLWGTARLLKRGWKRETLFFTGIMAYAGFRFLEEFIRPENATDALINPVQWGLLLALPVLGILIWDSRRSLYKPLQDLPRIPAMALVLPLLTILLCRHFWTTGEFLALGMLVFAFGAAKLVALQRSGHMRQLNWVVPASLAAGIFLMSQAAIDQTVDSESRENWVEVGAGAAMGRYNETCGNNHAYSVVGTAGQFTHNIGGRHQIEAGVRAFAGSDDDQTENETILGGNPYFSYQNRWVGAELGLHAGRLIVDGQIQAFVPEGQLRLGPSDIFFAEMRFFNNGYTPMPGSAIRFGIGSGFGIKNGTVFRAGICSSGFYVNPSIVIQKNYMIEPMLAYGDPDNYQLGLGLRVRLGLGQKRDFAPVDGQ